MINRIEARFVRRATRREWKRQGWGVLCEWPVHRRQGKQLVFSVRVPDGMRIVDIEKLVELAEGAPAWLRERASALQVQAPELTAICAGALIADDAPDKVVATMTAALAEAVTGPPDVDLEVPATGEELRRTVTRESDQLVLIDRLSAERPTPDADPIPVLLYQYLMESRYGALSVAFSTTNTAMMTEADGRRAFRNIFSTGWIGEGSSIT